VLTLLAFDLSRDRRCSTIGAWLRDTIKRFG
jgi:hypothetical protein